MAALITGLKLASRITHKNPALLYTIVRNHGWNKDFKPGPYPQTQAERDAAAKKYGLHPAEYEPYPDDGSGYGDYPKLPDKAIEFKDIYELYDFPESKRNLHEPIHADIDFLSEDRYGSTDHLKYSLRSMWLAFFGVVGGSFGLYFFLEDYKIFPAIAEKQLPSNGKTYYTFEPLK